MEEEFNLSKCEELDGHAHPTGKYSEENVKEFIKKLKEVTMNLPAKRFYNRRVCEEIDKLAGDDLT